MYGMLRRRLRGVSSPLLRTSAYVLLALALLAVAVVPVAAEGMWRGEYYDNRNLSGAPVLVRTDDHLDFNWYRGSPGAGIPSDEFSVRWTALPYFQEGDYRFIVTCDDGARLWVDEQPVIDQWHDQGATTYSAIKYLSAGYHSIRTEYYEARFDAVVKLSWENASAPPPTYPNWRGEYFNNTWLGGSPAMIRDDAAINFNWGYGSPGGGVTADNFSVRWTKNEYFASNATYGFTIKTDDGMRVWVDGTPVIDAWYDQAPTTHMGSIYLNQGHHEVRVEYYEKTGVAVAQVSYQPGGVTPGVEVIVDDLDSNFIWGGPASSWYRRALGYRGHMCWTWNGTYNLFNWGKWIPTLPAAGNYEVYAYIPNRYAGTSIARYRIFHNGQRHDKMVSQTSYYNQWVSLGTYYFSAAGSEYVFLGDNTGEPYASRFVGYDAMKFVSRDGVPPPPGPTPVPPPAPTPTPPAAPCAIMPVAGFGRIWNDNAAVSAKLGCPTEAEKGVWAAEEVFIGGYMFWRSDLDHIYVLYSDGTWQNFADPWHEGDPESDPAIVPPPGYYQPVRGFGKIWRDNATVMSKLSWASTEERSLYASVEAFNGGTMLWSNVLGIFVLYNDGTWAHYY